MEEMEEKREKLKGKKINEKLLKKATRKNSDVKFYKKKKIFRPPGSRELYTMRYTGNK